MPIIRNPFRKQDENVRPTTATLNGVEQKGNGTPTVKPIDIREKEPAEYQLSEINDSGVYLPPDPPERKSFWTTSSSRSTTSSNHRSLLNENEQFNISRESFDSYRRSFDISARSPIVGAYDAGGGRQPRASLDSRTFQPPPPRSSNSFTRPSQVPAQTKEESDNFEDVDIADRPALPQQQPKKRGLFSRMTDSGVNAERPTSSDGAGKSSWHHLGRKRGQSGTGAELGSIPVKRETTPKPESQLRGSPQHVKQGSVDKRAEAAVQAPKVMQEDTPSKAASVVEPQVQAGAEVKKAEDGMETLNLDEPAVPKDAPTPKTTVTDEAPKAPKPQNPQAPEIPVDS